MIQGSLSPNSSHPILQSPTSLHPFHSAINQASILSIYLHLTHPQHVHMILNFLSEFYPTNLFSTASKKSKSAIPLSNKLFKFPSQCAERSRGSSGGRSRGFLKGSAAQKPLLHTPLILNLLNLQFPQWMKPRPHQERAHLLSSSHKPNPLFFRTHLPSSLLTSYPLLSPPTPSSKTMY